MSNASLFTIPIELHHRIFDYLDVHTIIHSVRCVCTQFYKIVNAYNRFKLDLTSIEKSNFKFLSRIIKPESVISLTFSDGNLKTSSEIDLFFSTIDIHRFIRIRSLTFYQTQNGALSEFFRSTQLCSSTASSNRPCNGQSNRALIIISAVVAQSSLLNLDLNNSDYILQHIHWPVQCKIQNLSIASCDYREFHLIFCCSPHLRTLAIQYFSINDIDKTRLSTFASACYPQLTSLTMDIDWWEAETLQILLAHVPSLLYHHLNFSTLLSEKFDEKERK